MSHHAAHTKPHPVVKLEYEKLLRHAAHSKLLLAKLGYGNHSAVSLLGHSKPNQLVKLSCGNRYVFINSDRSLLLNLLILLLIAVSNRNEINMQF